MKTIVKWSVIILVVYLVGSWVNCQVCSIQGQRDWQDINQLLERKKQDYESGPSLVVNGTRYVKDKITGLERAWEDGKADWRRLQNSQLGK